MLLEREGPLAVLTEACEAARQGRGSVVLVTGEPGIGKSALVGAFAAGLPSNSRVFIGTCDDLKIPRPLGPFRDLAGISSELSEALAADSPPHQVHGLLLTELGLPPPPTVMIIEDVHWADEATVDVLTFIGRRIADRPAVLILTYRPGEAEEAHPLRTALASLRPNTSVYIQLGPLSREGVAALTGNEGEDVYALTGGNPFYVTEMIAAASSELPPSIANAVLGRVAHLEEKSRKLIELVAMMPSRMPTEVLDAAFPDWEEAAVGPERLQLLHVESARVRFRHELARAVVENNVPAGRRRMLHGQIVAALARLNADAALLVHHAEAAGDLEAVAQHALPAARRAKAVESNREAYAHFRRAADFADRIPDSERARLFEELALMAYTVDQLPEAFTAVQTAIDLNLEAGDRSGEGRCRRLLSRFHWYAGQGEEARKEGTAAVRILEQEGSSVDLAMAYSGLSQLAMLASADEEALAWGSRALALADELGNAAIKAHALINIGVTRTNVDPDDIGALTQAFAIADQGGDRHEAVRAIIGLAWSFMIWVRPGEATHYAERGIAYANEHQVDTLLAYLNATNAWLKLRAGDWAEAEELAVKEVQKGVTVAQLLSKTVLAELAGRRGDADAGDRLAELANQAEGTGELQRVGPVLELEMEWALTRNLPWPLARLEQAWVEIGPSARKTVGAARLAGWGAVAGMSLSFHGRMPDPYAAMAQSDWQRAAQEFGRVGWQYDRALMLSLLDDKTALFDALEIARGLGARPLEDHLKGRIRSLGWTIPRKQHQRRDPAGLTDRQGEVLELLAEGLTNAEIAERLYVSARTAEHHVSAVMGKLAAASRREAVRKAKALRLLDR